jgi:signal transduction histidine kinase
MLVNSKEGEGTEFILIFPTYNEEEGEWWKGDIF